MEVITNAEEIRRKLELYQKSKDPKLKKTMSVPEMRRLLGVKKTESYWLVHRNFFETKVINGQMRIDLDSFEKWYANQVKHKKVNGEPPGAELKKTSYSFREAANLLGVTDSVVYGIWKEQNLETITVDFVKRIPKDVFEKWYQGQTMYQKVENIPKMEELQEAYISVQEAAQSLKITKEKLSRLAKNEKYRDILKMVTYDNKKWILKKGLHRYRNIQDAYEVTKKKKRRSDCNECIEEKIYLSRKEAAIIAGASEASITKWMQAGKFPCTSAGKVVRIEQKAFLAWIDNNRRGERKDGFCEEKRK